MRYGFVLSEVCSCGNRMVREWTRKVLEMDADAGSVAELTARLRPWALETVAGERLHDGRYCAYLVELDGDDYDTYNALSVEDVFWFYESVLSLPR